MAKDKVFEEDIVREVVEDYNSLRQQRQPLEAQWRLNMNFLAGNQYCEIGASGEIEDYGKQYFWQAREVFNHIAPIIETRLAKLSRVKALVSVRPFSNDDSDIKTAQLSTQILRAITEENNLMNIVNNACSWSEVCGSAFYKVVWNKDKGMTLGKNSKGETVREGDIEIMACPAYEIFPDNLTVGSIDECRYIIHAKAYTRPEVKEMWGIDCEGESVEIFAVDGTQNGGGLGYSATSTRMTSQTLGEQVVVLEKYERPTEEYPKGRLIIVAGNKLAYMGELPYVTENDGEVGLPFARQIAIDNVACFYGLSVIERIIPIQRAYNSIKNRKHEFLSRIAMGVLAVEDGSVDTEGLEEEGLSPGKILVYRQGSAPPKMMEMGNVPNDFTIEEERLQSEFMQISGVSELMRYSSLPSNVTSGVAIGLLQEQDETRIITTAEHIRQAVKRVGQMILRQYKQFAESMRIKRLSGDTGELRLTYFKGSDLSTDDLIFDTDNELTETPANRKSMVFELIKMGLLQDESGKMNARTRLKVLEMLGFGNWESAKDIEECHRDKALKENLDVEHGEIMISEYDKHDIHILEHTKAIINGSLKAQLAARLDSHIKEHELMTSMKTDGTEGIINGRIEE